LLGATTVKRNSGVELLPDNSPAAEHEDRYPPAPPPEPYVVPFPYDPPPPPPTTRYSTQSPVPAAVTLKLVFKVALTELVKICAIQFVPFCV
jgi:hypothetical protein